MTDTYGHSQPNHHAIADGAFACTAPEGAPCRTYPTCDCEEWNDDREWGKERGHVCTDTSKPGQECWIGVWLNLGDLEDSYDGDAYEAMTRGDDGEPRWPDGPITTGWEGDYVTWEYASGVATNG